MLVEALRLNSYPSYFFFNSSS